MITIRQLTSADAEAADTLDTYAFVGDPSLETAEHNTSELDWDRTFGAEHPDLPGRLAGLYTSYDLRVRVPGASCDGGTRAVPVDGLSWVAVHPDVRRRGVLAAMIRRHLETARERGAAIAGLHASESGIYGRFGYGVASHDISYTLGRGTEFSVPESVSAEADRTTTHLLLDVDDDEIARRACDVDAASSMLGEVALPYRLARRYLRDTPEGRRGREPMRGLVAVRDGRDVGMTFFSRKTSWGDDAGPGGTVTVHHLCAVDPAAMLALGRRLVDMDLMARTEFAGRGLDDLLLVWAGSVRSRKVRVRDALWLRPVDVGSMLAARGYAAALDVVLEVTDPTCEWNRGAWRLVVDEHGEATCERTRREAGVHLDVDVLGEMFLGLRGPAALAASGRLREHTLGAVAAMTRAFATGVLPIGGVGF
ncbi:GNAT family N-acetyltransferase [Mobilicoccus massiliensis]|uniref:GNAT family N-acetyltransferase n=1 Tax=Mobilicoccus massiliensis TaxID=1522310 RepID=UPI0006941480|nr:GNAT family N-acetyltransferase [Mobilicoccus massiliensis]